MHKCFQEPVQVRVSRKLRVERDMPLLFSPPHQKFQTLLALLSLVMKTGYIPDNPPDARDPSVAETNATFRKKSEQ